MGASINVSLSQKSQNTEARTSVVNVKVTVTSTAGTHNHYTTADRGAVLTLTIDGSSYSYVAPFGSEETGTFTETLYSNDVTVSHNSDGTKTLFVSAVLATGVSAGTVSDSASLTLTPMSSSGGSGGTDSDDDDDDTGGGSGSGTTDREEPIVIANDSNFDGYRCYIDTYHSITNKVSYGCELSNMSEYVKFVTPSDSVDYDSVMVTVSNLYVFLGDDDFVNYTVSLRDANNIVIASKSTTYDSQGSKGNVNFELYPATPLEPNTEYRITTTKYQAGETGAEVGGTISQVHVIAEVTRMVNEYLEYVPYIDNGTSWDEYT